MILMQAPGPNETFGAMPSGTTYVSNQYCLIFITNNSTADQAALAAAGCYTLSPFGGWGTYGFPNLAALYAADLATNLVLPGQTGFPANTMAVVYSDTTASNNGTWVKSGTGNGSGNWTYLAIIPSSGATAAAVSAAQAATSAATSQAQAAAAATSATNALASQNLAAGYSTSAATSANLALTAGSAGNPYPNAAATYVPQGVAAYSLTSGGSGGTNGTNILATFSGGTLTTNPTIRFDIVGGIVANVRLVSPGLYIGTGTPTMPTVTFPGAAGSPAIALTAGVIVPLGQTYWAASADSLSIQEWSNAIGNVPAPVLWPNGKQVSISGPAAVAAIQLALNGATFASAPVWSDPRVALADPNGNRVVEFSPTVINHPQTNTYLPIGVAPVPTNGPAQWESHVALTDSGGNRVVDFTANQILHPQIATFATQIAALQAGGTASTARLRNGFFFIGDSRLAQNSSSAINGNSVKNRLHFFHKANMLLGGAMTLVGSTAVSGLRSDQYLTQANINTAIASAAKHVVIYGFVNDAAQNYTAAQAWAGYNGSPGISAAITQLVAAGMNVILGLEAGADNLSSAQMGEVLKYRQRCREAADQMPGVVVFDMGAPVWAGTSTSAISFVAGSYQNDSGAHVHPGILGGALLAQQFVNTVTALGITPIQRKIIAPWEIGANGAMQLLQNPLFNTATGGTAGTGVTGSVPGNWTAGVGGGALITGISAAATTEVQGGLGNDITITATGAASGDQFYLYQAINVAGLSGQYPAPVPGDIYQGSIEISTSAGSSNFCGAGLSINPFFTDSTFLQVWDGYAIPSHGAGPTTPYTDLLHTDQMTIPAGKTFSYWLFEIFGTFTGAGSATVTLRQPRLDRCY